jgi:hypothetical protein
MRKERDRIESKKYALASYNRKKYIELKGCWYIFEYCVIADTEVSICNNIKSNKLFNQTHHIGRLI